MAFCKHEKKDETQKKDERLFHSFTIFFLYMEPNAPAYGRPFNNTKAAIYFPWSSVLNSPSLFLFFHLKLCFQHYHETTVENILFICSNTPNH